MNSKKRPMPLIKTDETTFDKILAHHVNPEVFPLTEAVEEIKNRLYEIFALRLRGFTKPMIVKMWKRKDISESQAYIDIRNSEALYGNMAKVEKEGYRAMWLAWAEDFKLRCQQKGDRKNEAVALKLIAEYGGFQEDDAAEFNADKLANVEVVFALPKQYLKYLKHLPQNGKGGVDDLNLTGPIEDIDYEEIREELESDKKNS
ncbi:hypothetical protein [Flavobacterium sp.]|uniref:hypothetical protein n=1 Tax=Flavobacterium sp. TaxID=239 RepID=UPI001220370C|nr:hypothetical protein [Flavobacterium sp.]RZJ71085.1 MAG: hypothetical protein EOO49_11570 [Flavobacterium sp.]